MNKQLKSILLIDDSEADIFLMTRIIEKVDITKKIVPTTSAREALDYLAKTIDEEYPSPSLIFLDINMPDMTGWDFLEEYKKLPKEMHAHYVVCLVTTSKAKEDKEKAAQYDILGGFTHKPLTEENLMSIVGKHFPDRL